MIKDERDEKRCQSLFFRRQFRSVGVDGAKVVGFELRMVRDDLLRGRSAGDYGIYCGGQEVLP